MIQKIVRIGVVDDDLFGSRGIEIEARLFVAPDGTRFAPVKHAVTVDLLLQDPRYVFDVVVLDLNLQDDSSVGDNVAKIRARGIPVLILSGHINVELAQQALAAGASGICQKQFQPRDVLTALYRVYLGQTIDNRELARAISSDLEFSRVHLSPRERETLKLYVVGYSASRVAESLTPSVRVTSVKTNLQRIREKYAKAGRPSSSRWDLRCRAIEDGLIDA